jgi:hypothetical protein
MDYKKFRKILNQVVVVGETKKSLFRKSKTFELQVYYTPVKNQIMIINISGVPINHSKLFIDFKVGDNITVLFDWCVKYNHEIIYERNRI